MFASGPPEVSYIPVEMGTWENSQETLTVPIDSESRKNRRLVEESRAKAEAMEKASMRKSYRLNQSMDYGEYTTVTVEPKNKPLCPYGALANNAKRFARGYMSGVETRRGLAPQLLPRNPVPKRVPASRLHPSTTTNVRPWSSSGHSRPLKPRANSDFSNLVSPGLHSTSNQLETHRANGRSISVDDLRRKAIDLGKAVEKSSKSSVDKGGWLVRPSRCKSIIFGWVAWWFKPSRLTSWRTSLNCYDLAFLRIKRSFRSPQFLCETMQGVRVVYVVSEWCLPLVVFITVFMNIILAKWTPERLLSM